MDRAGPNGHPHLRRAPDGGLPDGRRSEGAAPEAPCGATPGRWWLEVREKDLRVLERERALRQLLVEVGEVCAGAVDAEGVARTVLVRLGMNLDAVTGWVGLPVVGGEDRLVDCMGGGQDARAVIATAHLLRETAPAGVLLPLGPQATASFPGAAAGGRGCLVLFDCGADEAAWLLLVGPPVEGIPEDAAHVLVPAAAFLGLAVARLDVLDRLRALNRDLERRVAERTEELRREKETLEVRVRERTEDLERARRAALDSERRLLERERGERVHQLAAGLAHELNNPLGAIRANLEFLREGIEEARRGCALPPGQAAELDEAVGDCLTDVARVAQRVQDLFGEATPGRRAALRTDLGAVLHETVRHYGGVLPGAVPPVVHAEGTLTAGVAPGALMRWLLRLLTVLPGTGRPASLRMGRHDGFAAVEIDVGAALPASAQADVEAVRAELADAGGRLVARPAGVRLVLPPACGERLATGGTR